MHRIATALSILALLAPAALAADDPPDYRYFLLRQEEAGVALESVAIASAEPVERVYRPEDGVLDVVLTVGPGGSGSILQQGAVREWRVRCRDGAIGVTAVGRDGRTYERPARTLQDLAGCDVRVSVSGARERRAFLILQNREVVADDTGGVVDPFGGKVPLGANDYVLFTDTFAHATAELASGRAPLVLDRWPFVLARVDGGPERPFVVDLGAGTTVVVEDALPEHAAVAKQEMAEYSSAGKRLLDYAPEGATGTVGSILGRATLRELTAGSIVFRGADVDVIAALPRFAGREVGGILGLDLLRRARVVDLALGGGAPSLRLAAEPAPADPGSIALPFSLVRSHAVVAGALAGESVRWILDSGAPDSILDRAAAAALGLRLEEADALRVSGLDGGSAALVPVEAGEIELGGERFAGVPLLAGDLAIFASMRAPGQLVGLLGASFLTRFDRVALDFEQRTLVLSMR